MTVACVSDVINIGIIGAAVGADVRDCAVVVVLGGVVVVAELTSHGGGSEGIGHLLFTVPECLRVRKCQCVCVCL